MQHERHCARLDAVTATLILKVWENSVVDATVVLCWRDSEMAPFIYSQIFHLRPSRSRGQRV